MNRAGGFFAATALAVAGLVWGSPAIAAVHALVIGINHYAYKHELYGAVADATDLANSLRKIGVADLNVLLEEDATRDNFERDWAEMVGRAERGDVLILTFAGHGISVPETGPVRKTPDGIDKGFLLQPYDEAKRPEEMLRDEHMYDLFKIASDKGLKIFFVADACHAGAGMKGGDLRAKGARFRFEDYDTTVAPPPAPPPASTYKPRPPIPEVVEFGATDELHSIPEISIDGAMRGALSYAVARGLEGGADPDHSGVITATALKLYVAPVIRERSEHTQIPQFNFTDANEILFDLSEPAGASGPLPELRDVPLAVVAGTSQPPDNLPGATWTQVARAELIWDPKEKQLLDPQGDIIASDLDPAGLGAAVAARGVVNALRSAMEALGGDLPAHVRLVDTDGVEVEPPRFLLQGRTASFSLEPTDFPYLTAFDISATGNIQFMWPIEKAGDPLEAPNGMPLVFKAPVTPPFGFDLVVFLATQDPLRDLHQKLIALNNKIAPGELYAALRTALAKTKFRIGMSSAVTCASVKPNGQCNTMLDAPQ